MASLMEMIQAAEYQRQGENVADPLQSATKAATTGFTKGAERGLGNKNSGLDQALKILKLRDTLQDMKRKQEADVRLKRNDKFIDNKMKASGQRPYNEFENKVIHGVDNEKLGTGDALNSDRAKTTASKTADVVEEAIYQVKGSGGRTLTLKRKPMPKKKDTRAKDFNAERKLAIDYAEREYSRVVTAENSENGVLTDKGRQLIKDYDAPNDEIEKYMPAARAARTGVKRDKNIPLSEAPFIQRVPPAEIPPVKGSFFGLGENPAWNEATQIVARRLRRGTEADLEEFLKNADQLKKTGVDIETLIEYINRSIGGGK